MARDLARRLGVELEAVQVLPSNRVQFLQAGKVDALIAGMEVTPERDVVDTPTHRTRRPNGWPQPLGRAHDR